MGCRSRDLAVVAAATMVVVIGARAARDDRLRAVESRVFTALNGLDGRAFVPVWVVMQLGSLGGAVSAGATVAATGRTALGRRLAAVGALTWLGSKTVKPLVGRGRPSTEVDVARVLGSEQSGLGYPSGHAGVAAAMVAAAAPHVPRALRPAMWVVALGVGTSRVYVGAHLPLDVAGGFALGVATERAVRLLAPAGGRGSTCRHGSSWMPSSARSSWLS